MSKLKLGPLPDEKPIKATVVMPAMNQYSRPIQKVRYWKRKCSRRGGGASPAFM